MLARNYRTAHDQAFKVVQLHNKGFLAPPWGYSTHLKTIKVWTDEKLTMVSNETMRVDGKPVLKVLDNSNYLHDDAALPAKTWNYHRQQSPQWLWTSHDRTVRKTFTLLGSQSLVYPGQVLQFSDALRHGLSPNAQEIICSHTTPNEVRLSVYTWTTLSLYNVSSHRPCILIPALRPANAKICNAWLTSPKPL